MLRKCIWLTVGVVAATVSTPRESDVDIPELCPIHPPKDLDEFYLALLASPIYIDSIRPQIIPDECFAILSKRFDRKIVDDVLFEDALQGSCNPLPSVEPTQPDADESAVYVAPLRRSVDDLRGIRLDDFIASEHAALKFKQILKAFEEPEDISRANLLLYYLNIDLTQRSACVNLDSRIFRKLVEQIHYQVATGVLDGGFNATTMVPVLSDLYKEVMELEVAAQMLAIPPRPQFMIAPVVIALAPVVAQATCWCIGQCIKYYNDRTSTTTTTTTTTTTPSTIAAWVIEGQRRQIEQFISVANADLDDIMIKIGSVSDADFDRQISVLRTTLMVKIMAITKGMIANAGGSFDSANTIEASLKVTELLSGSHTAADWPNVRREILSTVSKLRSELFAIRALPV